MQGPNDQAVANRKLSRRDLSLTVPPELRHLPAHVIQEEMERRRRMLERFEVHNPRFKRRLAHYVIGAVIFMPLMAWFFTPVGMTRLPLHLLFAAGFGVAMAYTRASGLISIGICILYCALIWFVVAGIQPSLGLFPLLAFSCLFFVVLGWFLGTAEDLQRMDGS